MKTLHLKLSLLTALAAIPCVTSAAPVPLTGTMIYNQNFDALGTSTVAWANDATVPGWYAQINNGTTANGNALPTDGSADLSGLLNCGSSGSNDRAFGSKTTGTTANIACAVSFQNTSTSPIQFAKLNYTGELWRTNSTAAGLAEVYTVYYQVSSAAVTDIISGTGSATPAAGAGFTALGAGANWSSPTILPAASALDGNAAANRTAVSFAPATTIVVPPGQFLMIKWTDTNLGGTDGFQAIDDISVEFTELSGSVTATASARTRDLAGTPLDPTDDTFGFTANITGTGSVGPNWITTDVNPPLSNANSGPYGTSVTWTGFPIDAPRTVLISDVFSAVLNSMMVVAPPPIIGSNHLVVADAAILQEDNAAVAGWTIDDAARSLSQTAQTVQSDKIINSQIIDLSTVGFVQFAAELNAISGNSSGFEAADSFALELIIDGGAPVSVLGATDTNSDGRLRGLDDLAGPGTELPSQDEPDTDRHFSFSYIIPDTANSVQIRIIGNSNSANETLNVTNLRLGPPPPTVLALIAGPSSFDNKGTVAPDDDEFSGIVNIFPVNLGASTGWHSDETIPRTGLYSAPNPVTFGSYPISGGAKTVILTDDLAVPAVSSPVTIPLPPAAALTASALTNVVRIENGPGPADDGLSFDVVLTGTNGGPGWNAAGASPASGPFGLVTFRIPAPLPASPFTVTITDISYPTVTLPLTVVIPERYTVGQRNLGDGLKDVLTDLTTAPAAEWVNDAGARTLTMTAGPTADAIVTSEIINLSGTGTVYFTANLNADERSNGSNFETNDRFKAELIIDGGTATEEIINLVSAWDTGDGAAAIGLGGGPNGPPNGYINGFQGIALAPDNAETDYNNHFDRDEFNLPAGDPPARQVADFSINNNFPLSYTIPATANSVQLKVYGAGVASSETFLVSGVLFTTSPPTPDSDGDGVSTEDELTMGTDPNDASDVLRLSQNAGNGNQLDFPTKAGRFYRVYVSDDTDGQEGTHLAVWKDASLPTIAGDGNTASFTITVSPGEARRFYRLHVMTTDGTTGIGDWPATVP